MPGIPGRIHRPRLGLEGARPIQQRWEEARQRVLWEIPEGNPLRAAANLYMDELNIDAMNDAVAKYHDSKAAAAQAALDPALQTARDAVYGLIKVWNTACAQIKTDQGWLKRAAADWRHIVLGDLGADLFGTIEPYGTDLDHITSVRDAHLVEKDLTGRVDWIRGIVARIDAAKHFEKLPYGEQCFEICRVLAAENTAIKSRVAALEAQLSAIQATSLKSTRSRNSKEKVKWQKKNLAATAAAATT